MKLILTQDVEGLGAPGDVVEVNDGYGRNYLVPRGFGIAATKGAEKHVESLKRARELREVRSLGDAKDLLAQLKALDVRLPSRAGEGGRLFGSVTASDIASAVKSAGGPTLDKRKIAIAAPIKTLGSHQVTVKIHPELDATIAVEVVAAT
jgi:large subunit ribosomal protein L9